MSEIIKESHQLPKRLLEARSRAKLTQTELGELIGSTKAAISSYEQTGKNKNGEEKRKIPSLETAIKLSQALNITLDELCGIDKKLDGRRWLRALADGEDLFDGVKQTYTFSVKPDYENECDGWAVLEMSSPYVIEFFKAYIAFEPVRQNTEIPKDIAFEAIEHMLGKYGQLIDEHGRERPGVPLKMREGK